jgi:hypothetical protein
VSDHDDLLESGNFPRRGQCSSFPIPFRQTGKPRYVELESVPDEAVGQALAQFGNPGALTRAWKRATSGRSVPSTWRATWTALFCFAEANSLMLVFLLEAGNGWPARLLWGGLFPTLALLLPLCAGLATGLLAPARQAWGALYALLAILPATSLALPHLLDPAKSGDLVMIGWLRALLWLPVGCWAAALGGRLRARGEEQPGRWLARS